MSHCMCWEALADVHIGVAVTRIAFASIQGGCMKMDSDGRYELNCVYACGMMHQL